MKDTLNNLLMVKNMIGWKAQGSANCSALGYAMQIVKRHVIDNVEPTVDSRAEWEDSINTEMQDWLLDQSGKSEKYTPWKGLNDYAFIIESLQLPEPILKGSVDYLKTANFQMPSKKDMDEMIGEVLDEHKTREDAEAAVIKHLQEDHERNCSDWEKYGDECVYVVESMFGNTEPVPVPDAFKHKLNKISREQVVFQRKKRGFKESLGDCKLLKLLWI